MNLQILRALRSRPFTLLWLGQTISALGDGAFTTALAWEVLLLTGSATAMGLVVTAEIIPHLLFLLLGGVAADRLPRRFVMLCSDGGRAVIILLIAILGWLHILQLWHLITLSLLFGVAEGFFAPAYASIPPQLVKQEDLASANALTGLSRQMSLLLGPLLGAGLVALTGPISAFAFDGLSFIASAVCLFVLRLPPLPASIPQTVQDEDILDATSARDVLVPVEVLTPPTIGLHQIGGDLREGMRFVLSAKWFWIGLPIATLGNILFSGPLEVAMPKLVHDVYGSGVWFLGILWTTAAVGSIVGTFLIGQFSHLPKRGILMYLMVLLMSIAEIFLGIPFSRASAPIIGCIANGLIGFGSGAFGIIWVTLMQELVPPDKLGRVSSIDQLGAYSFLPVGYALTGIATDSIGPAMVFLIAGIANVVLAVIALAVPDIRRVE